MASLNMFIPTPAVATTRREKRVVLCKATSSAKSSGKSSEEKSILDWVLSGMQKEDQFFETDPILQKKVDEDESPTAPRKGTVSVSAPKKKTGGFGGLFAK